MSKTQIKYLPFDDVIFDSTGGNAKIKQTDYLSNGNIPVVDQGEAYIGGYTDYNDLKYKGTLPCIIFGDHTKIFKYIDFDFALGADGTKVLTVADQFDTKFIYYYLRNLRLPENVGYSRHFKFLKEKTIPDFSKEYQIKVRMILDKSSSLINKRQETIKLTDEFLRSTFLEMFGDPINNNSGQPTKKLGSCASLTMGGTPSTLVPEYYNGSIHWMKSGDIRGDFIYSVPNTITKLGLDNSNTKIYPIDSVVIALNGQGKTRGTTAILKISTASNQSVANIDCDKKQLNPIYLHYQLKLRYQEIRNLTGDSDRSGLNLTILRELRVDVPNIDTQNKFESIVNEAQKLKVEYNKSLTEMQNLFNSLMQKAFRGDL